MIGQLKNTSLAGGPPPSIPDDFAKQVEKPKTFSLYNAVETEKRQIPGQNYAEIYLNNTVTKDVLD